MRLKNHTNIPDDWVRAAVRAVCPPGVVGFDLRISNLVRGRRGRGRAYPEGSTLHDRPCPFIVVSVAKTEALARDLGEWRTGGYLKYALGSRREVLLAILAHELRHLWQRRVRRGHRVWDARGVFSERDADAYAVQMLRRYRRGEILLDAGRDV